MINNETLNDLNEDILPGTMGAMIDSAEETEEHILGILPPHETEVEVSPEIGQKQDHSPAPRNMFKNNTSYLVNVPSEENIQDYQGAIPPGIR